MSLKMEDQMAKVDVRPFMEAEQALVEAAKGIKQIRLSSSSLKSAEERMSELLKACDAIVTASETLRLKGAEAMGTIAELDLKGSLERLNSGVRTIERVVTEESKNALQRHIDFEKSLRELREKLASSQRIIMIGVVVILLFVPLMSLALNRVIR